MFSHNRDSMRRYFLDAWHKSRSGAALEPLEHQIAEVVREHPEYQALLEAPEIALAKEYLPEGGETNPFLHLSLHLTILEQVATDRPPGVRALYLRLLRSAGDAHQAAHQIMDCLAESLWEAQRAGLPPNEQDYLECIERLARQGQRRP
ncbi:MAG: DUF1841 family protein [Chromatiaceae bacterium]|nr:DUF1841 family protein [Chromatiaceae bacterium]